MTWRGLASAALLLLSAARVDAQARVVPEPGAPPRRPRAVPAPQNPRARRVPAPPATPPSRTPAPTRRSVAVPRAVAPPPAAAQAPAGDIAVTLITFGTGEAVWERFGHNALWIHDRRAGSDIAYNWGLFDFEQPGFFRRFLTGDTRYWMAGEDAYAMISAYQAAGRPVTLQRLNLTAEQARSLNEFVQYNAREENKFYRYDYFRDNCSTRLCDAVDRALGGALRAATDTMRTALTYRGESVRLTEGQRPVQTGIDIALGRPADAPLSAWESFFIPMRLRDAVRIVSIPSAGGAMVPLVADERLLEVPAGARPVVEARTPPDHTRRNLIAGAVLGLLAAVLGLFARSQRWAAWLLTLIGMGWSLVTGVLGVILLLAWLVTKHDFWDQNENLLLFSPLSLLLVVLLPAALLARRAVGRARTIGFLVAVMALVALALSMRPGGQPNQSIVALILPMHLALLWALSSTPRSSRSAPATGR